MRGLLDPPGFIARRRHGEQRAHRVTARPGPPPGRYAHRTTNAQTCANPSDQPRALILAKSHSLHRV